MYAASPSTALLADTAIVVPRNRIRLVELEALRGIAAFIVVAWHFLWAFDPARIGIVDGFDPSATMLGSVGFASIDGPAAVTLFFVLSGFVLPLGVFRTGRPELIVRAVAKRWLRLVCLVLLAVMVSWLLFRFGLYQHREAAQLSQSAWLGTFGGSHPGQDFTPSLPDAVLEGLVFAFVREPDQYNPVLWTMHHEFIGSFVSYFLAIMLWRARPAAAAWYLGTAAIVVHYTDPYLFAFVVGTGLAWLLSRSEVRLPLWAALACIAAGIFLFGYLEPRGSYAAFGMIRDASDFRFDRIAIHTASGVLIILGLVGSDSFGQALTGAPFRLLGKLSFPVYLFHFPLLCSLGCAMFVALRPLLPQPLTLLLIAIVYLPVVVLISYGFARIDEAWLLRVNRFAQRLTA